MLLALVRVWAYPLWLARHSWREFGKDNGRLLANVIAQARDNAPVLPGVSSRFSCATCASTEKSLAALSCSQFRSAACQR